MTTQATSAKAFEPALMSDIRDRFAHVDQCPFDGERIFFENAGGALTLNSVVDASARFAAIPDNQGRDNVASAALMKLIDTARADAHLLFNEPDGQMIIGESGTELLFRLIRSAVLGSAEGGSVVGTSLEHPASRSAAVRWSDIAGKSYQSVPHDLARGVVGVDDYLQHITPDTRVLTIIHTSPVTGMAVDIASISHAAREIAPECFIVVDGIQHAAHGLLDLGACSLDGYVISPYKMFSRHGYGVAWMSPRLAELPRDALLDGPPLGWELGTRDTGSYATFSEVVRYLEWLGSEVSDAETPRARLEAAGAAIHAHEQALTHLMLHGEGNLVGLAAMPSVNILGGVDNPAREGLVALTVDGTESADVVAHLRSHGIRAHVRKNDHYSGSVLSPLGLESCVRVSLCHYNTEEEVKRFLGVMQSLPSR